MKLLNTRSITHVAPILLLGLALLVLLFSPVPVPNKEIVMSIVSGLLGFLSRPTTTDKEPTP